MTLSLALDFLWLSLLGGWVATDSTSFGQFMVSRPLVAASLAGWIVGDPISGAALGVVLEAFHLNVLPVGAARYPEAGPAAVVAGAAYAIAEPTPGAMLIAISFALVWEWVAGQSVHRLRHANVRLATPRVDGAAGLQRRHLGATGLDFLRGVLLFVVGYVLLTAVLGALTPYWGLDDRITALITGGMLVGLLAGSFRLMGGRTAWFAVGLAGGAAVLIATA